MKRYWNFLSGAVALIAVLWFGGVVLGWSLVTLWGFVVVLLGLLVFLAALPGIIAHNHQHPDARVILILGLIGLPLGGLLWLIAAVWAFIIPELIAEKVGDLQAIADKRRRDHNQAARVDETRG